MIFRAYHFSFSRRCLRSSSQAHFGGKVEGFVCNIIPYKFRLILFESFSSFLDIFAYALEFDSLPDQYDNLLEPKLCIGSLLLS